MSSWESFFLEHHLDDLVKTGCFTHYEFRKLIGDDPMSTYFVADFYFETMEDLSRYNDEYAKALKHDVTKRFNAKFQFERSIYHILSKTIL